MKLYYLPLALCVTWASSAFAGVFVSAPTNNSTVGTTVQYVATAQASCGVAAMGIYTAPGKLAYKVSGAKINTLLTFSSGTYHTVVQEWDKCGGSSTATVTINVGGSGGGGGGNTFTNLHQKGGWQGFALLPTSYAICSSCSPTGPQLIWYRGTGVSSPSLTGNSTQHHVGGKTQYADALWNNHLIGDFSSQGLPDNSKTLVPSLHNFTYDVYFYAKNISLSQALEFDINQFFGGMGFIWGHECRIAGGHQWDIWDNVNQHWIPTGIPCNPINNAWNHLVLQVQRTSSNQLVFKSITLNGQTATLNHTENHGNGHNWYGVTINYQQDGNKNQDPYDIWLDKLNFSYW
jgi:hypothetical protein